MVKLSRSGPRFHTRHEAGVDPTIWWSFKPGERVMTAEGVPGVVTAVEDGPYPGSEQYIVALDGGLGGGEYSSSELARIGEVPGRTASMRCSNCRENEATATVDLDGVPEEVCESCAEYMVENMGGVRRAEGSRTAAEQKICAYCTKPIEGEAEKIKAPPRGGASGRIEWVHPGAPAGCPMPSTAASDDRFESAHANAAERLFPDAFNPASGEQVRALTPEEDAACLAAAQQEIAAEGSRTAALTKVFEEQGEDGNRTHITYEETGTVPTSMLANLTGLQGETPGAHRNRQGEEWESFKADIAANGILNPIFITIDWNDEPHINEGNHRRDAAIENGMPEVPVQIRYFGNAQKQGLFLERMQRMASTAGRINCNGSNTAPVAVERDDEGFGMAEIPAGTINVVGEPAAYSLSVLVGPGYGLCSVCKEAKPLLASGLLPKHDRYISWADQQKQGSVITDRAQDFANGVADALGLESRSVDGELHTAADDYPELGDILVQRPDHPLSVRASRTAAEAQCEGSGRSRSFSTGDQIGAGNLSGRPRARVKCPNCGAELTGRVIYNDHGVRLPTPMVRVPNHQRKSKTAKVADLVEVDHAHPDEGMEELRKIIDGKEFTHVGLAVKAVDSGRVLLVQRTPYEGDDEEVYGRWEFPGGGINDGEDPYEAALREFGEETGLALPEKHRVIGGLPNGKYLLVMMLVPSEGWTTDAHLLDFEVMGVGWFHPDQIEDADNLVRKEMDSTEWDMVREAMRRIAMPEIGWSPRSAGHIIVGYPDGRPLTACGKTLSGLSDNYWIEDGDTFDKSVCAKCQVAYKSKTAGNEKYHCPVSDCRFSSDDPTEVEDHYFGENGHADGSMAQFLVDLHSDQINQWVMEWQCETGQRQGAYDDPNWGADQTLYPSDDERDVVPDLDPTQDVIYCPRCGGSGYDPRTDPTETCIDCGGTGIERYATRVTIRTEARPSWLDLVPQQAADWIGEKGNFEPGHNWSYDWCRFRRDSRCYYPKQLDEVNTQRAGYAVYIPEDRGFCPRQQWDEQKACPVGEPGPHSKDPKALPDATRPYDEGGQRMSVLASLWDLRSPQYDKNYSNCTGDPCELCGRELKPGSSMVEVATDGTIIAIDGVPTGAQTTADSQGAFPVGSECIKKVRAEVKKMSVLADLDDLKKHKEKTEDNGGGDGDSDFDESEHPRKDDGKFAPKSTPPRTMPDKDKNDLASDPVPSEEKGVDEVPPTDPAAATGGGPLGTGNEVPDDGSPGSKSNPVPTDDIEEAAKLLTEGKYVDLQRPKEISTLLDKLASQIKQAKASGQSMSINLCQVTVKGTNLFCVESKGIPRIQMPQLKSKNALEGSRAMSEVEPNEKGEYDLQPLFRKRLEEKGFAVTDERELAANLKATQSELNTEKIAGMTDALLTNGPGALGDEQIFVSKDDYIVDGHHRWAGNIAADWEDGDPTDLSMDIARVDMGIIELLAEANRFATEYGIPQAGVTASRRKVCCDGCAKQARLVDIEDLVSGDVVDDHGVIKTVQNVIQMGQTFDDTGEPIPWYFIQYTDGTVTHHVPLHTDFFVESAKSAAFDIEDHDFSFHFTAGWRDVQSKAKSIRSTGGVRIISSSGASVVGEVRGETALYQTSIFRFGKSVAMWECGCKWAAYSWGRSGRWRQYEGRMCSHALALTYEAQAQEMFGGEITEQEDKPMWRMDPTVPVRAPGDQKVNAPGPWRMGVFAAHGWREVSTDASLHLAPAAVMASALLEAGDDLNEAAAKLAKLGARDPLRFVVEAVKGFPFRARIRGVIHDILSILPSGLFETSAGEVHATEILYPTYDPHLGLDLRDSVRASLHEGAKLQKTPEGYETVINGRTYRVKVSTEPLEGMRGPWWWVTVGASGGEYSEMATPFASLSDAKNYLAEVEAEETTASLHVEADDDMEGPRPMTPERAYKLGWDASARLNHDLERDEAKFMAKWGHHWWNWWMDGWEDYAVDREYGASLNGKRGDDGRVTQEWINQVNGAYHHFDQPKAPSPVWDDSRGPESDHEATVDGLTNTHRGPKSECPLCPKEGAYLLLDEVRARGAEYLAEHPEIAALAETYDTTTWDGYDIGPRIEVNHDDDPANFADPLAAPEYGYGSNDDMHVLMPDGTLYPYDRPWFEPGLVWPDVVIEGSRENSTPTRVKSRDYVNNAVRDGRMEKPDRCSNGGCKSGLPVKFHHTDYRSKDVGRWLCDPCHERADLRHGSIDDEFIFESIVVHPEDKDQIDKVRTAPSTPGTQAPAAEDTKTTQAPATAPAAAPAGGTTAARLPEPDEFGVTVCDTCGLPFDPTDGHQHIAICPFCNTMYARRPSDPVMATLNDEPEPALPETDGDLEEVPTELLPGHPSLAHLMKGSPVQQAQSAGNPAMASDSDIAARAKQVLSGKVFTQAEQHQIINEGEDVTASNLDKLDIAGTHYVQLEEALSAREQDDMLDWAT